MVIFITVLFSAFFSGLEIAFISVNKLRLELEIKQNTISSKILAIFTRNPGKYIATMLVGNNIALVIYGIAFAKLLEPSFRQLIHSDSVVLILQTITSTLIILVTAEFLPKTLFRINSNRILRFFSIPLAFFYFLFYPISKFSMGVSKVLIRGLLNEEFDNEDDEIVFSRIELDHFVKEQHEHSHKEEAEIDNEVKLFRNALDFSKVKLREIMIPRTEIEALDINSSVDDLVKKLIETGYSRILFYQESIDNIVGYVHHSVIFKNPDSIKANLKKAQLYLNQCRQTNYYLNLFSNIAVLPLLLMNLEVLPGW